MTALNCSRENLQRTAAANFLVLGDKGLEEWIIIVLPMTSPPKTWVAVQELKLSYHNGYI